MTAMAEEVRRPGTGLDRLTLYDFNDRELLLIVLELCEASDGFTSSADIAEQLGIRSKHPKSSVGSRMASLARIGAVMRDPDTPQSQNTRWAVTPIGQAIASGRLKATQERALQTMDEGALLLLMRGLADRWGTSNQTASQLIRREWMSRTGLKR